MNSKVASKPDLRGVLAKWRAGLVDRIAQLGDHLVLDFQLRLRQGRDALGAPQKPNKPETQLQKARRFGDITPLVASKLLSVTGRWRIEVRGFELYIAAPEGRAGAVIDRLVALHYRVPLYTDPVMPPALAPFIGRFLGTAFHTAATGQIDSRPDDEFRRVLGS